MRPTTRTETETAIERAYRERTPRSGALAERARASLPSGIVHDGRYIRPYGIYVQNAQGARKTDTDGNRYIDYFGGHGALMLGHNPPAVVAAVSQALSAGTHFAANTESEAAWAEWIRRLVPAAEKVRFTASGTEATLLAVRLARACTGRSRIVRVRTHFHGWHDQVLAGWRDRFDNTPPPGVPKAVQDLVTPVDPGDVEAVEEALRAGDVAAVVVEPTGGTFGMVPIDSAAVLPALREATHRHGALLLLDEVITGFRVAPGGAQEVFGVRPDLVTFAKIVAGGLPGGAVAGRADILDRLDFDAAQERGFEKVMHPGTFNGNPLSAAAGTAMLAALADGAAHARANAYAETLRQGLNEILEEERVPWAVYGTFSGFHLFMNPEHPVARPTRFDPTTLPWQHIIRKDRNTVRLLRLAMLLEGVDLSGWPGGLVSAAHGKVELEETLTAFRGALARLRHDAVIS